MHTLNWFMIIFCGGIMLTALIGMPVMLIKDAIHKKRRDKRNHCEIRNWWEIEVDDR